MAEVIVMTQLSPTMEEGVIARWLRGVGDRVKTGDPIAEVETDKATMEMESFFDGTILKLLVAEGDPVRIGRPMAIVGRPGEDISSVEASLSGASSAAPAPAVPAPAAPAPAAAPAAAVPAAAVVSAPVAPSPAPAAAVPIVAPAAAPAPVPAAAAAGRVLSSPLARKVAADLQVDLTSVTGSGPAGRVVKRDVVQAAESRPVAMPVAASAVASAVGAYEEVALSPMRKAIARNLSAAWAAPAFMLTRELEMDAAMRLRKELNAALEASGAETRLSVNDLVIKASAKALIDVPEMNASYHDDRIRLWKSADIGIAVALEGGLITPIVRGAQAKSVGSIADEAKALIGRARDRKLQPDEYTGATFSISNLGMYGIEHFTAVLNPPAAGILAVGAVRRTPVVTSSGELGVGERMTVTLTCDHRTVDGAVGARWLQRLALYLQQPTLLLV